MQPVAVLYATREGQTRQIAEQVAAGLRRRGLEAVMKNLREPDREFDLAKCSAAVLAASVHAGTHEREMIEFGRHIARACKRCLTHSLP